MSSEGATEHIGYFTVCGEGLTNLVRDMYCYEDKQSQALDILENLEGITIEQAKNVCTGKARLEDTPDGLIHYIPESDEQFQKSFKDHKIWKENHLKEEADELSAIMNGIATNPRTADAVANNPDIIASLTNKLSRVNSRMKNATTIQEFADAPDIFTMPEDPVIPEPSEETIRIGEKDVPKNLIDRYANHVVKRIRASIKTGAAALMEDPMMLYNLELERQALHDTICKAVGLNGQGHDHDDKRSEEYQSFDNALQTYLDKHAGSLFNGEGD